MEQIQTDEWVEYELSDICKDVRYGYTASSKDEKVGPKFLRITDIVPDFIDWNEVPYCEINEKDFEKYELKVGDIVVARTGATTGYAKRIKNPPKAVFASYLVRLKIKDEFNDEYVGYVIESDDYKEFIKKNWSGAAQPNANAKVITSYSLKIPDDETQQKIASILSAFDDLISTNTRRIEILEEMARRIYSEWFVHFRYPGHQEDELVDSGTELGKIPVGWEIVEVQDVIDVNPRTSIDKEKERPYLPMANVSENSMLIDDTDLEYRDGSSGSKFKNYDTLFARITPSLENGKTGFAQFLKSDEQIALGSTEFIVLRSKKLNPYFVYCLARDGQFRESAIKSMVGASGRQRVRIGTVKEFKVTFPPKNLLKKFGNIVGPMFKEVGVLSEQNKKLKATRDLLLPKLISGKIDLEEMELAI